MSIPRIIHQIWIGPRPAPTAWMDTWPGLNPDLEHRVWDDAAIASFGLANVQLYSRYIQAELYDGAVDVARIEILHRLGGVYVDADSIALRPIADASFMRAGFFAAWEPPDSRKRAVSGSPPVSTRSSVRSPVTRRRPR